MLCKNLFQSYSNSWRWWTVFNWNTLRIFIRCTYISFSAIAFDWNEKKCDKKMGIYNKFLFQFRNVAILTHIQLLYFWSCTLHLCSHRFSHTLDFHIQPLHYLDIFHNLLSTRMVTLIDCRKFEPAHHEHSHFYKSILVHKQLDRRSLKDLYYSLAHHICCHTLCILHLELCTHCIW